MDANKINKLQVALLLSIAIFSIIVVTLTPALSQDVSYHNYADDRMLFGITNFFNVTSNILFLLVGIGGINALVGGRKLKIIPEIYWAYFVFFIGLVFICFGSVYYHLGPSNSSLVWDRVPISLSSMAYFTIILAEYISVRTARIMLLPLLIIGAFSVGYWHYTELLGRGDLRLYVVVQFLPMLLIPLILVLFPSKFSHGHFYWMFFGLFLVARMFELNDRFVYQHLHGMGGHMLKHILAALACYVFLIQLKKRSIKPSLEQRA